MYNKGTVLGKTDHPDDPHCRQESYEQVAPEMFIWEKQIQILRSKTQAGPIRTYPKTKHNAKFHNAYVCC